jgi:hypothetical protein
VFFPSCGWADRARRRRPLGNLRSWLVYRTEILSCHWPGSGVGRHNCGCRVDGPLSLPHNRSWVFPCLGVRTPNSKWQGSRSSRLNTRLAGVKPVVS